MNKKFSQRTITVFTLFLTITLIVLPGCIKKTDDSSNNQYNQKTNYPTIIIDSPKKAFFDEKIKFDASKSYDANGEIISYSWNMGDNKTYSEQTVSHEYKFKNEFNTEIPIIYTIVLTVTDDDYNVKSVSHQISLYPKKYVFYLSPNEKIIFEKKPDNAKEKIPLYAGFLSKPIELKYSLNQPVNVSASKWNLTLNVDKKSLNFLKKITIKFYNNQNQEIRELRKEKKFNWLESITKNIKIQGVIDTSIVLKSVGIEFKGFDFLETFEIIYFEKPYSSIYFNFEDSFNI